MVDGLMVDGGQWGSEQFDTQHVARHHAIIPGG